MRLPTAALALLLLATPAPSPAGDIGPEAYAAALAHPDRSADDRERDARRRPAEVLSLAGIAPGMAVVDLMAGGGWYTEVLARSVGPRGSVIAQNSPVSNERYGAQLRKRLATPGLPNARELVAPLDDLGLASDSLDAAFLVQFYHDTYWMGVDRAAMNAAVYRALRPGGVFVVIDHAAEAGSGARDVQKRHRVDEALVREEVLAAGFRLAAESQLLRNPEDDRTANVFDSGVRGRTDRFVLVFEKPAG